MYKYNYYLINKIPIHHQIKICNLHYLIMFLNNLNQFGHLK